MSSGDKREYGLRLNRADRKLLGVCSGFARYLDVPPLLIRVIYCVACIISPVLILAYFVIYWCLKEDLSPGKMRVYVSETKTARHFKQLNYRKPLYRNPDDKKIAGVCSGIADYLSINSFIVRLVAVLSLFILGAVVFWVYIVCWIILDKRPAGFSYSASPSATSSGGDPADSVEQAAGDDVSAQPQTLRQCAAVLSAAEARLREVEAFMTSKQFRLHCEINRI